MLDEFQALSPSLKAIRGRDGCFGGWLLEDFWKCVDAQAAKLTRAEVCALRLYTGPAYRPINAALRSKSIAEWATTIACCFSGVLKLSMLRKNNRKERVYRGVQEEHLMLPSSFLDAEDGALAGGVECAAPPRSEDDHPPQPPPGDEPGAGCAQAGLHVDHQLASDCSALLRQGQGLHLRL